MSVTNGEDIKHLGGSGFSAKSDVEKARVSAAYVRRTIVCPLADVVANTATLAEKVIFSVPANLVNGIRVKAATITTAVTMTADASSHRTFTLKKYDAAGANGTTVAAKSTDSDATPVGTTMTAFVPSTMVNVEAATIVVSGGTLTIQGTGAGTEPELTGAVLTVDYEEL